MNSNRQGKARCRKLRMSECLGERKKVNVATHFASESIHYRDANASNPYLERNQSRFIDKTRATHNRRLYNWVALSDIDLITVANQAQRLQPNRFGVLTSFVMLSISFFAWFKGWVAGGLPLRMPNWVDNRFYRVQLVFCGFYWNVLMIYWCCEVYEVLNDLKFF